MFRTLAVISMAASAFGQTCRTITVENGQYEGTNAQEIASQLNNIAKSTTVLALGPSRLLACTDATTMELIQNAVRSLSKPATPVQPNPHFVRRFFNRDPPTLPPPLNTTTLPDTPFSQDTPLFIPTNPNTQ